MEPHTTQLRLCHEHIGARSGDKPGRQLAWCDLPAEAWCFDCEHYVCDIHLLTRHADHRTQTIAAENEADKQVDRRSGEERRAD